MELDALSITNIFTGLSWALISFHQLGCIITAHGGWLAGWHMLNPRACICYLFVPINRPMILHRHLFNGLTDATISYSFE